MATINPFKPGAGHMPPYLAGRTTVTKEFQRLLKQDVILENLLITGLRGVGKTVLLDTFKPIAIQEGWIWVGTDLSESASLTEEAIAHRLITDLAVVTTAFPAKVTPQRSIGFGDQPVYERLDFKTLVEIFTQCPGMRSDKLKGLLQFVWENLKSQTPTKRGIIFAYDEAQFISDHAEKDQYPAALVLDVFQSIQKSKIPFMLILSGLPTLFPKLVESRTYAERMFRVITLERLSREESVEAMTKPTKTPGCTISFPDDSVRMIYETSQGYPYFIQFICREVFDIWIQRIGNQEQPIAMMEEIVRKLDDDFFVGRWARATDRQRELLQVIALLPNSDEEFTVQEVTQKSRTVLHQPFSSSHINQMLNVLCERGLVYKDRYGKYRFAVPLFGRFILRQLEFRKSR